MTTEVTVGPPAGKKPAGPEIAVTSAPASAVGLTPEERRQRYDALRARMGRAMTETTPPAGKAGYWARINDAPEMGRLEYLGFKIVKDDPKHPAWIANGAKEDGTYVIGDVILMEIDADIYEFLLHENVERGREMIEGASGAFELEAARSGVPTFDPGSKSKGR